MNVTINGEPAQLPDDARVSDVVTALAGNRRDGIAVAMDGEIVPRSEWDEAPVPANAKLEVLSAIGGG